MTTFNPSRAVARRDGAKARIITTSLKGEYPIAAAISEVDGSEFVGTFTADGRSYVHGDGTNEFDLVNVPVEKVTYQALYLDPMKQTGFSVSPIQRVSIEHAKRMSNRTIIGFIKLTSIDGKPTAAEIVPA